MIFKGKYNKGIFVPLKGTERMYKDFIRKVENNDLNIQIEVKRREVYSENQVNLLNALIYHVSDKTGHTFSEVLRALNPLRIDDKPFSEYSTVQMNEFIERSNIFLNEFFDLNISIIENNGKAKIG